MNENYETAMRTAIALAQQARDRGNHPFGAVLMVDGEIVATAENTVNTANDITRHAELNLVSQASQIFDRETLARATLVTSTEPCAMCSGAIFWAGIRRIVYGCSSAKLGEIAGHQLTISSREVLATGQDPTQIIGPVLPQEAISVHEGFWHG